ncbi:hypothetical protein CHELA41_20794 [Hyphomicrobiales bacterium]|nr:hypothetical protein CHELA41_20794 [Hyphomicrobiales bacterium]
MAEGSGGGRRPHDPSGLPRGRQSRRRGVGRRAEIQRQVELAFHGGKPIDEILRGTGHQEVDEALAVGALQATAGEGTVEDEGGGHGWSFILMERGGGDGPRYPALRSGGQRLSLNASPGVMVGWHRRSAGCGPLTACSDALN